MTAWKLTDLPPAMRKQAEVQLAKKPDNRVARTPADMESHTCHAPVGTEEAAGRFSCVDIRVHQVRDTRTDPDGASLKAVLDSVVKAGLLPDDGPENVREIRFSQRKTREGEIEHTTITLTEVGE